MHIRKKQKNIRHKIICPIVILARGGSKEILKKNIKPFAGKPLILWSIFQGLEAKKAGPVFVSSDDPEILSTARKAGAMTIVRSAHLSRDTSSSESGWQHALVEISKKTGQTPKAVVVLQATSPLREARDIDRAVATFAKEKADSLFSACFMDDICLWKKGPLRLKAVTYDPQRGGRRQDRAPFILENGSIYVFKTALLRKNGNRVGGKVSTVTMPLWKSLEINDQESFDLCELIFLQKLPPHAPAGFARKPKLIVYDFDGVMTNNHALVTQTGSEAVWVNRSDGWGIQELRKAGIPQAILSTEKNPVVAARARKLKIGIVQGSLDKAKSIRNICRAHRVFPQEVLFVGNDVNDLPAMRQVGFSASPADGHPEVLKCCDHITRAKGGEGVIREIADLILGGRNLETTRS